MSFVLREPWEGCSWQHYAFLMRAYSTYAMNAIWRVRATGTPTATSLCLARVFAPEAFSNLGPRERLQRIRGAAHLGSELVATGQLAVWCTWLDDLVLACGDDEVESRVASLCAASGLAEVRTVGAPLEAETSLHDQIEELRLLLDAPPHVGLPERPLAGEHRVPLVTTYGQRFLIELVAKNRRESVESVVREAVALLLDTEPLNPAAPRAAAQESI